MMEQPFEVVEHTADWALRVRGRDLAGLLVHAAQGMSTLLVGDLTAVPLETERAVVLDAYDAETLLVDWLSELAFWAEMEQLVFREFTVTAVTPTHLEATARGGPVAEIEKHIKAVTYHNLEIKTIPDGLEVTIVFDV